MITKIVPRGGGYTITTDDRRVFDVETVLLNGQLVLTPTLPADILAELATINLGPGLGSLHGGGGGGAETDPIYLAQKGAINGVATLDGTGNVPLSQLGNAPSVSFPLEAPNGTVAAPSYTFANDTETGLYLYSVDALGIAAGGTFVGRLSIEAGQPQLLMNPGSATNPAYSFADDTDTGMFLTAPGFLEFEVDGLATLGLTSTEVTAVLPLLTSSSAIRAAINVGSIANDPSTLSDGDIWYETNSGKFRAYQGGIAMDMIGGGGGGWTSGSGIVQLATTSDTVVIGDTTMAGTEKVRIIGDLLLEGIISVDDGVVTSPSLTFNGGTDSGFFFDSGTSTVVAVAGGQEIARFQSSSQAAFPDGSSLDPGITFMSNNQTGMFYDSANFQLGFSVSGTALFAVDDASGVWSPNGFKISGGDFGGGAEVGMRPDGSSGIEFQMDGGVVTFHAIVAASETNLEVNVDGTSETARVTIGADDSGGVGFRVLLVPNAV